MSEKKCSSCGAAIDINATECKYCGEPVNVQVQYHPQQVQQHQQQYYKRYPIYTPAGIRQTNKNKIVAGLLAIFLGGIGVHKFYLGNIKTGFLYLIFCWTYIPVVLGIIEGIMYIVSSDDNFYDKYINK